MHTALRNKKLIIFDWDGTLFDAREVARKAAVFALKKVRGEIEIEPLLLKKLGYSPCQKAFEQFDIKSEKEQKKFIYFFLNKHRSLEARYPLIEGALVVLKELKRKKFTLALATGRSSVSLYNILERTSSQNYFSSIKCLEDCPPKPDPYIIEQILSELNIERENCLLVGDSKADFELSENAEIDFLHAYYCSYRESYGIKRLYSILDLV